MSKEDLARFKSADAKLLALQRRKALLDEKAVELDDDQAVRPARIMVRAEQDFSGQSLGASSGQLAKLAAHDVHSERYHASEPEQRAQWSMSNVTQGHHLGKYGHCPARQCRYDSIVHESHLHYIFLNLNSWSSARV